MQPHLWKKRLNQKHLRVREWDRVTFEDGPCCVSHHAYHQYIGTTMPTERVTGLFEDYDNRNLTLLLRVLSVPLVPHAQGFLGSLDATESHCAKGRAHAVGSVDLTELHPTDNETRHNLTSALDDGIFGSAHVETTHASQLLDLLHADETLDAEGAERTIMSGGRDDKGSVDGVGVHAGLIWVGSVSRKGSGIDSVPSWCMETSVQLVTTPAIRTALRSSGVGAGRVIKSSTVVALKSFTLGN